MAVAPCESSLINVNQIATPPLSVHRLVLYWTREKVCLSAEKSLLQASIPMPNRSVHVERMLVCRVALAEWVRRAVVVDGAPTQVDS